MFKLFVVQMHQNLNFNDEYLKAAASMLLKRLYNMDSRRAFCPPGHFVAERTEFWPSDIPLENLDQYLSGITVANPSLQRTLTLLHHVPFVVPFEHRVLIFRNYINRDADRSGIDFW